MQRMMVQRVSPRQKRMLFRRVLLPALMTALCLFGAVRAGQWIMNRPVFTVREVRWSGIKRLDPQSLAARIRGLEGENIFRVSLREILQRLESEPGIKTVTARRELPDRILIRLDEREPAALLVRDGGMFLMDGEGMVLEPVASAERVPAALPRLEDEGSAGMETVLQGLMLIRFLQAVDATGPSKVSIDASGDLLTEGESTRIRWGWGDYPTQWHRLQRVLLDLEQRGDSPSEIDLRFEHQVVARWENKGSGKARIHRK